MSNEHLNHAYLVDLFANREHCEQLLADTSAFGGPWIQVDDVDSLPPITRGIYVITLVSPYRIESSGRSFGFRNPLYINRTEDVRNIYCAEHVVREEKISELFEAHKFAPFHALNDIEFWFLPIPTVSAEMIDSLLNNLRGLLNPPYNFRAASKIKASSVTNLSAPAF